MKICRFLLGGEFQRFDKELLKKKVSGEFLDAPILT